MRSAVLMMGLVAVSYGANAGFERARERYEQTDYRAALSTLKTLAPKDAAAYDLMGKAYYMDGQYKNSTAAFHQAIQLDPTNSSYYDWLGKAYGRRAEEASWIAAMPLANKTHDAFEKAVALDPHNLEALGDLFEYDLEAPGFLGGGVEKAQEIAARIGRLNEAEFHYTQARMAQKRKNLPLAERELRRAVEMEPDKVGRVIDLAKNLAEQGRYQECDRLFDQASQMAPDSPKVLFERASTYIHGKRRLEEAQALLQRYEKSRLTPDDPPRSEVARLYADVSPGRGR
jgi:tetratricopeptide (TPR) repeat protein